MVTVTSTESVVLPENLAKYNDEMRQRYEEMERLTALPDEQPVPHPDPEPAAPAPDAHSTVQE
jgi:hypothetical protein